MRITNTVIIPIAVCCILSVSNASAVPVKSTVTEPADIFSLIKFTQKGRQGTVKNLVSDYIPAIFNDTSSSVTKPEKPFPDFFRFENQNHHNFYTESKTVPEHKHSVLLSFGAFAIIAIGFIRKQKKPSE